MPPDPTGKLPPALGDLTGLAELRLNDNALTGPIPLELQQLAALTHLYLANNALTGCVFPSLRSVANNDLASLGLIDCSTQTYLEPVPEAVVVGEEVVFDFSSDVQGPSVSTAIGQLARWKAIQQAQLQGLSMRATARLLGISRDTVSSYVRANGVPGRQTGAAASSDGDGGTDKVAALLH